LILMSYYFIPVQKVVYHLRMLLLSVVFARGEAVYGQAFEGIIRDGRTRDLS